MGLCAFFCCIICTIPVFAFAAYDVKSLDFEWENQGCTLTTQQDDAGYTITLDPTDQNSYAYGFQRQILYWNDQDGLAVSITNDSENTAYLALQLSKENWDTLSYEEGTGVLLQNGDTYYLQYITNGVITLPPHFNGRVLLPFASLADSNEDLMALQGFAFTFSSSQTTRLTLSDLSFWEDGISSLLEQMSALSLHLSQEELLIPTIGETIGFATVTNGETHEIDYMIEDIPAGIAIDQEGRIAIDNTCEVKEVTVIASIDQQVQLEETLILTTPWDIMPEDQTLEEFIILDPSNYSNIGLFALINVLSDYVHPTQRIIIGLWLLIGIQYFLWRRGSKKS